MVVLMMSSSSHDADTGANGITWLKGHIVSHFDHTDVTNAMMPLMTLLASSDTDTSINGITWLKVLCCILLQSYWPNKCNDVIGNAIGLMRCWCEYQHFQMTEKVMLPHFNHVKLAHKLTKWCLWKCYQCHVIHTYVHGCPHNINSYLLTCINICFIYAYMHIHRLMYVYLYAYLNVYIVPWHNQLASM